MDIRIDLIKPSAQPVRTTWDEEKMDELVKSIAERGVIAPIKVRTVKEFPDPCPFHGYRTIVDEPACRTESGYEPDIGGCSFCRKIDEWIWPEYVDAEGCDVLSCDQSDEPPSNGHSPFEIVYGHRRFEACKRLGLAEIPAIIGDTEDTDALLEQIIENEVREDVPYAERAEAYVRILTLTGWSQAELSRQTGISTYSISIACDWLNSHRLGVAVIPSGPRQRQGQGNGVEATVDIRRVLGDDIEARRVVAAKVSGEELGHRDARPLAEAYKAAEDDHERQAIIDTPYRDEAFKRLVKVRTAARQQAARDQQRKRQDEPREVALYLDALRTFRGAVQEAIAVAEYGKFSPEAGRFVKRWQDQLREDFANLETILEESNA